jgi:hypothetical protein
MDCGRWASFEQRKLRLIGVKNVRILYIENMYGRRLALGPYKLISGQLYKPSSGALWYHHYAVIVNCHVYDEGYPNGLPFVDYVKIFQFHSELTFTTLPRVPPWRS